MNPPKLLSIIIIALLFSSCRRQPDCHREIPYPKSNLIKQLVWTSEPKRYPGTASDMHWWTWGIDDAIYTAEDDGSNFEGRTWYAHILRITGIPPEHKVETVTDFEGYDFRALIPDQLLRRYICGIIAIDSVLYLALYDYDWNLPSVSVHTDTLHHRIKEFNPWHDLDSSLGYNMGFTDAYSKLGGVPGIIRSDDQGKTWENIPGPETQCFFGPCFGAPAFLTFGPGNSQTPEVLKPYIYAVSNDVSWETGDHVRLGRVHRDSILFRKAWHFYNGKDKKEDHFWIDSEEDSKPIFSDPGHVGHPTITYNKGLNRYFLLIYSDVVPHRVDASPEERTKWDRESELQIYESEYPWGPWFLFHCEKPWGGKDHTCYLGQIPSKWLSEDGLSGYIMFAGDYINRSGEYYGLMIQPFKLLKNK